MINALKKWHDLLGRYRALYVLSALELTVFVLWSLFTGEGETYCIDTETYYSAYNVIISGKIDSCRTPLYPLLIGIPASLFGYAPSVFIVYVFQSLVFLCSIKWIGVTLEHISYSRRVAYWFTAIYALYPGVLSFCGIILTESLSVSFVSAVIYLASEAYYRNSYKKAALSGIMCLVLWLQRPALMPVTVVMIAFWICILLMKKEKRKTATYGICATLVSVAGLGIYSMMFYKEYQRVAITSVSSWNNYSTLREMGVIDIEGIENAALRHAVDSAINRPSTSEYVTLTEEGEKIQKSTTVKDFGKFVDDQLRLHPAELISHLYKNRLRYVFLPATCVFTGVAVPPPVVSITNLLYINNSTVMLLYLIAICVLISGNIKQRRISYFIWLIFALFAANCFTVVVGAPSAYHRLMSPNYPVLIAILCWLVDRLAYLAFKDKLNGKV